MDYSMMNYLHSSGKLPERYWNQVNKQTAQENYNSQRQEIIEKMERRKRVEALEKELEEQMGIVLLQTLDEFEEAKDALEQESAERIANNIYAVFNGGSIQPENLKSVSLRKMIMVGLARSLASAPFKLLEQFFDDEFD